MVSVFLVPELNDKATMMGYRNKSLYHKYVYNKIKYFLLMIWEIFQDNIFVVINNIYTYLNSEDAMVKLTGGVYWTDWCSGETDWWGMVKLIDALVKLTGVVCWWGWLEVNLSRVITGVLWWSVIGSDNGDDVI